MSPMYVPVQPHFSKSSNNMVNFHIIQYSIFLVSLANLVKYSFIKISLIDLLEKIHWKLMIFTYVSIIFQNDLDSQKNNNYKNIIQKTCTIPHCVQREGVEKKINGNLSNLEFRYWIMHLQFAQMSRL